MMALEDALSLSTPAWNGKTVGKDVRYCGMGNRWRGCGVFVWFDRCVLVLWSEDVEKKKKTVGSARLVEFFLFFGRKPNKKAIKRKKKKKRGESEGKFWWAQKPNSKEFLEPA